MADKKISALTSAATPLAGTEVLPIVQSGATVKVTVSNLTEGRSISALSLGLGVASPAYTFDFRSGSTATTGQFVSTNTTAYSASGYNGGIARFFIGGGNGTSAANGFELSAGGNNENFFGVVQEAGGSGAYVFQSYNGVAYGERFRIASNGDATVNNGNLVIGTAGKGIDFSATSSGSGTMTSELLADYEEGTWTPVYEAATGTLGAITYANVQGRYTKVGRLVTISGGFYCSAFAAGTGSGDLQITNLPFSNAAEVSAISVGDSRLFTLNNPTSGAVYLSYITLYYRTTANGAINNLQVSDAATGSGALNLVYFTASYHV